jgi:16S rRNA (cytosine1407-C5)-methyltransferase
LDEKILEGYRHVLTPAEFEKLRQAAGRPPVPAIRINTLKTTVAEAEATWPGRYGWEIEPVAFCPSGWRIVAGGEELARTPEYRMGGYYIQEAASMLPAGLFELEGGELVLDMAAAPGGKTTHLVGRMGDRGLVIANDSSAGRIGPLRTNLQDWGAMNTAISNALGEFWGSWFPERFDRVLLDAPCSGESLRTAERHRSRPVSERERGALQAQQIRLLTSGFQALRPGGQLVYATCTMHPDEDEAVLQALLERYGEAVRIASVAQVVGAPALTADGERRFHPSVGRAVRLWPHLYDTTGFFAALTEKGESVPTQAQPYPTRSLRERGFEPLPAGEREALLDGLRQTYGLEMGKVLAAGELSLWRRREGVYALPEAYLVHFEGLPVVAAGMLVAEWKGEALTPSHELVGRFWREFKAGRLTVTVAEGERWLQGQELRGAPRGGFERGTVVLVEDELGRPLGRGKVLGDRVRNLLPRRLIY